MRTDTGTQTMFGYPQLVPPEVDIAHISKVIDLATGTGAWVFDFASLPEVRDRNIQVFACDISTAKFPRSQQDSTPSSSITEPFRGAGKLFGKLRPSD
jgi:hypothetical protein